MVLGQRLNDLALFVACLLAILSLGLAVGRRLFPFGLSRLETVLLALGLGSLLVAYGVLLFGFLGWLHRTVLYLWLGFCYAMGSWELIRWWRSKIPLTPFEDDGASLSLTERLWGMGIILINLFAFTLCFVPPTQTLEWDSLSYHLAVPKLYWMDGRIHYISFAHHAQFPMTVQMLYLLGLGLTNLKSAAIAKLFHWLFFVLCQLTLLAWGATQKQRSLRMGLVAAVSFAALPVAFLEATTAYVDLGLTAFSLLSLFALVRFRQQPDPRWLLLAGIFAGAAAGTKYTGLLCIALLLPFGAWAIKRGGERQWVALGLSLVLATAIASPWYVKNWLWTGNPVFPFAYGLFGGKQWTKEMAHTYTLSNREFGGGRDLVSLLALPFNLALNEVRYGRCAREWLRECPQQGACGMRWKCGKFDNQDLPTLSIGVLPLAVAPLTLFAFFAQGTVPFPISVSLLAFFAWFVWWFMEAQYLRYLLPALGCLSVVIGWAVHRWMQESVLTSIVTRVTITVGLLYAMLIALWHTVPLLPVSVGLISEETFLRMTTPSYRVAEFVNQAMPRRSLLAVYGMPLGYYLDRRYFWADSGHNRLIPYERLRGVDDLMHEWQRLGVTHLIVDWSFVPQESDLARWLREGKERGLLEPVWQDGRREVLEVVRRR